jgi:energy-coupling factor transport system permease protein
MHFLTSQFLSPSGLDGPSEAVEQASLFTRLDFRSKLFMIFVVTFVAFIWESPGFEGLLLVGVLVACKMAGIKFSYVRTAFVLMLPFYTILILAQGFFATPLIVSRTDRAVLTPLFIFPDHWCCIGGARLSLEGVLYGLNIVFKTLTMMLVFSLGVFTTNFNTMIVSLVKAGVPYKMAFVFSSTFRFFPLLFEETQAIIEAQRLRGLAFEQMGLLKRFCTYASVAVPLVLSALVKSQTLEIVLQSRAFSDSSNRTYLHESKLAGRDYGVFAFFGLFLMIVVVGYWVAGIGRFDGLSLVF